MSVGDPSESSPTKSSYRRVIALVVVVALALGFLSYALTQSTPPTQPTSAEVNPTTSYQHPSSTNGTTVPECSTSASLPCGFENGTQGSIIITNASLAVSPSVGPNSSISGLLSLTIVHTGEFEGDPLTFYLCQPGYAGCGWLMQTTATGQTGTYTIPIYGPHALIRGVKYEVDVNSLYHTSTYPGQGEVDEIWMLNIAVTAN